MCYNKRVSKRKDQNGVESMEIKSKKVADSVVETVHIVRPNHLNSAGRLFGGILMQWIDEVAGLVGKRHTHCNVITASVDNLRFLKGAYQKTISSLSETAQEETLPPPLPSEHVTGESS